jgi:hypothetical protein
VTTASDSKEKLRQRLGRADVLQIRLLLRVPPERRVETMLDMQAIVLNTWRDRLQKRYPELSPLELTQLVFRRIYRNG